MRAFILYISLAVSIFVLACGPSEKKIEEAQRTNDSIAKADAEALEFEATIAQKMLDSTAKVNGDTIKKEIQK